MTTTGAADMAKPPMGFEREQRIGDDAEAIEKLFTPEFRTVDQLLGSQRCRQKWYLRLLISSSWNLNSSWTTAT